MTDPRASAPRFEVIHADITTLAVDAIVNAANAQLAGGGGVDGAVHRAAGPELIAACRAIGGCPTGEAVITPGFRLPARFVIHAVGPVWQGGTRGEPDQLASAYRAALELAKADELASIAFSAISTGVYGFPGDRAAEIAVDTVHGWLAGNEHRLERVIFCCFSPESLAHHETALRRTGGSPATGPAARA